MANHRSADKRNRQNEKRNERNRALRSRMRKERVSEAIRVVQQTASKQVIHKNTARRYVSRLAQADKRARA
jgi:small subunit ribosomal protein S20